MQGRSLAQIRGGGGGQCLLSKYQVAISVLLLGIINLKNHKNWKSQGGQLPPLPPAGYGPGMLFIVYINIRIYLIHIHVQRSSTWTSKAQKKYMCFR